MHQVSELNFDKLEVLPHCSLPFHPDRCKQLMSLQPFIHSFNKHLLST